MRKIGIVVQRFGKDVLGGAEHLAREIAVRLAANGFLVTVFTTCSLDYQSWANHYRHGEFIFQGVKIRRFPVEKERSITSFNAYSEDFFRTPSHERDELDWIIRQGPFAPDLINAIAADQEQDLFLFFTYLYYPTVVGIDYLKKPFFLFPTAHDEAPLYLNIIKNQFTKAEKLFFLTEAEKDLVQRVFNPPGKPVLLRTGLNYPSETDAEEFRRKYFLVAPYVLYAGRIESGKGLDQVLTLFPEVRNRAYIDLVLIGKKQMELPKISGIRYCGYVSEKEKFAAFRGALFSLQPSFYESLSFSTLESFSQKRPVLANGSCNALREHVRLSQGGFLYHNDHEFIEKFIELVRKPLLRKKMGENGYLYLQQNYNWDLVLKRLIEEINQTIAKKS